MARGTNLPRLCPVYGESKIESGAFADLALGPDATAMALDDALDNGQTHAGAFVALAAVQALKRAEQIAAITLVKPNPVVFDIVEVLFAFGPPTYFNGSMLFGFSELNGIAQ